MSHIADEVQHDREQREQRGLDVDSDELEPLSNRPGRPDKNALRLIQWAGDGPDPLGGDD